MVLVPPPDTARGIAIDPLVGLKLPSVEEAVAKDMTEKSDRVVEFIFTKPQNEKSKSSFVKKKLKIIAFLWILFHSNTQTKLKNFFTVSSDVFFFVQSAKETEEKFEKEQFLVSLSRISRSLAMKS
jgi:hypothetical protein